MSKRNVLPAEVLSAETQKLFDVLNNEPDFSAIVVSCAYVDACLGSILRNFLLEGETSSKLLNAGTGPLGSFAARSRMCYSLGLISKSVYRDLSTLGELRNQVAHHHLMLDFSDSKVAEASRSLKFAETLKRWDMDNEELMFRPEQLAEPRVRFVMTVALLKQHLLEIALKTQRVRQNTT